MRGNTLLYLMVGALAVYVLMQHQQMAYASPTANPAGGTPPAGDPGLSIVAGGLQFVNNIFDSLRSKSVAQTQPMSR